MLYKSERGYDFELKPIANIEIYKCIANSNLVMPKVPIYEDEEGRKLENPFSPDYASAMTVYDVQRHTVANDAIVKMCLKLVTNVNLDIYRDSHEALKASGLINKDETIEEWFIKTFIITPKDMFIIVQNTLLTEQLVSSIMESIKVTREGTDIHRFNIKNAIQTRIEVDAIVVGGMQLVSPIDEIRAATFSMMNWVEWLSGSIQLQDKAVAVALHRLDRVMEMHSSDAVNLHQEREARRKNKN